MANPNVVLCRAKVPQGVRASWEQSTAGQKTPGQPGGAACRSLFTLGPRGEDREAVEKNRVTSVLSESIDQIHRC